MTAERKTALVKEYATRPVTYFETSGGDPDRTSTISPDISKATRRITIPAVAC
jgi:hypothetical protein